MKILHTSDWHLGQKLVNKDRIEESRLALDWLYEEIIKRNIDGLIVSGDIFDNINPTNAARSLYYQFLAKLISTNCRNIVIIGGNHDSASMLDAPADLLKALNVSVIGSAREDMSNQIIIWKGPDGKDEAIICAVPFLNDRDLRTSMIAENYQERSKNLRLGIQTHYQIIEGLAIESRGQKNIPIIATGHLFAAGSNDEKESKIYVGNLENISGNDFPNSFSYVALGHIHRAQKVGKRNHIRYSGSLIPLSFSERMNQKIVLELEFDGQDIKTIHEIPVPIVRKLFKIKGDFDQVSTQLANLELNEKLTSWIEIELYSERIYGNLVETMEELIKGKNAELLIIRQINPAAKPESWDDHSDLQSLSSLDVFKKLLKVRGLDESDAASLETSYLELLNWMEDVEFEA